MSRGFLLLSLALFSCEVVGIGIEPPDIEPEIDETELVFDPTVLHEVNLIIDTELFAKLDSRDRERVPASIEFDGTRVDNIGVRLKGNLGSVIGQTMTGGKPSFSLKTNEFERGKKLFGVKKFTLDNSVQDQSLLSAKVGHEIFRKAGIVTSRTAYARVSVNDEFFGVYLIVESYNKDFLKRNFADNSGNLYEGPGDIIDVENIDLDTNEDINDRSDLEVLRQLIVNTPNEQFVSAVSRLVDLDQFLTYWAVEALTYHWDGYATFDSPFGPCCSPNNYNIYHEPTLNKLLFLPHGIDGLFLDVNEDVLNRPSPNSSLPSRLFIHEEIKQQLADKIREVIDVAWNVNEIETLAQDSIDLIRDSVLEFDRNPNFDINGFDNLVEERLDFLRRRPQIALDQLINAGL